MLAVLFDEVGDFGLGEKKAEDGGGACEVSADGTGEGDGDGLS